MANFIQSSQKQKSSKGLAATVFFLMLIMSVAALASLYYFEEQTVMSLKEENEAMQKKNKDDEDTFQFEKDELVLQMKTAKEELKALEESTSTGSLKTFGDQVAITAEIPKTWSAFVNPENIAQNSLPDSPTASISNEGISFGDSSAGQVDIYYAEDDIVDELINAEKDGEGIDLSEEIVGGKNAQVLTFDKNEDAKLGGGGKKYFLKLEGRVKTLVIHKQTAGDTEYEEAFDAFIAKVQVKYDEE